ncbi:MAG: Ig-like domain-containing protein [Verrucomicrobiales bacterium]
MRIILSLGLVVLSLLLSPVLLAASVVDTTFNPGGGVQGGIAESVLPLANGKILLSGNFTSFDGHNHGYLVRLNENGTLDPSFNAAPGYWVRHMAVQTDGKIVIGGFFQYVEGQSRKRIARLNEDGTLDGTFQVGDGLEGRIVPADPTEPFVFQVAIQPDGKIIAVGNFTSYKGVPRNGIVRLNSDGSLDTSFNPGSGFNSWGRSVRLLPDGNILATGWFENYNNKPFNRMVRIYPNGEADTSFNPFIGDKTAIYSTALLPNNQLIAVGHSINDQGLFSREMARMNVDGTFDESFIGRTNEKTEDVVIQSDGKIIVGGYFTTANGEPRKGIARFLSNGELDPSFQASFDNFVWTVAFDRHGRLMTAGGFNSVDGFDRRGVARLLTGVSSNPNNQSPTASITAPILNSSFRSDANITITANATDPDGSVAKVRFFANSKLLGESTSEPYTIRWLAAPAGVYEIRAEVTDNEGSVSSSSPIIISVKNPQNSLPSVALSSPSANAEFAAPASITLVANASDTDGRVNVVRFYAGNTLIGQSSAAPYQFNWQNVPAGEYDVNAEAEDNLGGIATSALVRLKVNTSTIEAPKIEMAGRIRNSIQLTISTQESVTYLVQASNSLTNPNWETVATLTGNGGEMRTALSMLSSAQFYRVVR